MRAVTRRIDAAIDLNDVAGGDGMLFVRDGVGVAGRGAAARIDMTDALEAVRRIDHDGPDDVAGVGPLVLGCMPFKPEAPATLTIPAVTVVKTADGATWCTTIDGAELDVMARPGPIPVAGRFGIEPATPVATYLDAVVAVRDAVRAGELVKAVVARDVLITSDVPIDVHGVLLRLRAAFGSSFRYSIDGFIGASPELLVAVDGSTVRSLPLAGTAPRTGDPTTDERLAAELIASTKDQVEHRVVIDMVHDTLLPWCSYLDWEPEPGVVRVANVQHLGTMVEGHLSHPRPDVVTLVRALSPTPALGGHPRDVALDLLDKVEGMDRGLYGGAVGWMDRHGNGTWAVSIRCAQLSPDRCQARLFAGGGIVADSEPLAELAETQTKLQAMLGAIVRA